MLGDEMRATVFTTTLTALGALLWLPGAAAAQDEGLTFEQQAAYCDNTGLAHHADLQIGGCSALMQVEDRSSVNIGTVFVRRGQAYARQGEHEAAIADYTAAVALDPRAAAAYYGRAQSRREIRAYAGAVADLDQVIRLRPGNAADLNSRCWARAVGNLQLDQALADCNASLAIEAGNRNTLDSRGLVKLRMGDPRGALADFTAAYDNTAARAHSLYGRGLAKIDLGRSAEGEADIAAAMAADDSVSIRVNYFKQPKIGAYWKKICAMHSGSSSTLSGWSSRALEITSAHNSPASKATARQLGAWWLFFRRRVAQ